MKRLAGLCKRPISLVTISLFLCLSIFAQSENVVADGQPRQDLRAVLYFLIGNDNTTAGGELPKELTEAAKEIKSGWNHRSLVLAGRQMVKAEAPGTFKSRISIDLGNDGNARIPTSFLDWATSLRSAEGNQVRLGGSTFSIRTPIRIAKAESGSDVFNYETFSTSMSGLSVRKSEPTLIGSLSLPATGGTLFMVIKLEAVTVR